MRLALAQYALEERMNSNLERALSMVQHAVVKGAEMIIFPELCLSPFFPQFSGRDASQYLLSLDAEQVSVFREWADKLSVHVVPNVYLSDGPNRYDASLMITSDGQIAGVSKMVHIAQVPGFFEQDYYTRSDTGFIVYNTDVGRVGIVVCFDRHFPESIRTCVLRGAQLILIPTANTVSEPLDMFEWEMRVAARQNGVWIAMCNRVGSEGDTTFCGESLVINPAGDVVAKAGANTELLVLDIDLDESEKAWQREVYIGLMRPDTYERGDE